MIYTYDVIVHLLLSLL